MSEINVLDVLKHRPSLDVNENGTWIVTGGTYRKEHIFEGKEKLNSLQAGLIKYAKQNDWKLQAWALFPNHYHLIVQRDDLESRDESKRLLESFIETFHQKSEAWIRQHYGDPDKKVWYGFWETILTFPGSYLARLHYVHKNPEKHQRVDNAETYPWCSAGWFEAKVSDEIKSKVYQYDLNKIKIWDEYD